MGSFVVNLPQASRIGGRITSKVVVSAENASDAKDICKTLHEGDGGDAGWDSATVTTLSDITFATALALVGWRFNIVVRDTSSALIADVTVTGDSSDDTLDEIGTALAVALNATASIANAGYTVGTQTLIIATGAGDALGDHSVVIKTMAPIVLDAEGVQTSSDSNVGAFVSSITDEGASGADLTTVFNADSTILPTVFDQS